MKKDYEEMLDRAREKSPKMEDTHERFKIPHPEIQFVGQRTVIINFTEIADKLRRNPENILKFLVGETATRGTLRGGRAVFQGRFDYESIKNLLEIYTNKYVICPVCGRPDTHIEREKRLYFLKCEACGAQSSIGSG